MQYANHTFTTSQVVSLLGIKAPTLQAWLHRGLIVGQRDQSPGTGARRKFTFFNLMEIALASDIMKSGFEAAVAFQAGAAFAHVGEHNPLPLSDGTPRPVREPGELYPGPFTTLLVFSKDRAEIMPWNVHGDRTSILHDAWSELGKDATISFHVVDVTYKKLVAALEREAG